MQATDGKPCPLTHGSAVSVIAVSMPNTCAMTKKTYNICIFVYLGLVPKLVFKFCIFNFFVNIRFYLFFLSIEQINTQGRGDQLTFKISVPKCGDSFVVCRAFTAGMHPRSRDLTACISVLHKGQETCYSFLSKMKPLGKLTAAQRPGRPGYVLSLKCDYVQRAAGQDACCPPG